MESENIKFDLTTIEGLNELQKEIKEIILMQEEYTAAQKERNAILKTERRLSFLTYFYLKCSASQEERNKIKMEFFNWLKYLPDGFEIEEE